MAKAVLVLTVRPGEQDPRDPEAHWAVPALARLLLSPPPSSGVVGDEDYHRRPPLCVPERRMPEPPKDMSDQAAVEKWLRHCMCLRMYGSGN
jgi:hypothetical protein